MNAKVYNTKGEAVSEISLPEKLFATKWNADLVHQVVTTVAGNLRRPVAHAKDRSAVSGGGKKPWKQKGTGRARHGSIRSPLWVGGGVTHGPRKDKIFARKTNRTMKNVALASVLSAKQKDGNIIFLDSISMKKPSTKEAFVSLGKLASALKAKELVYKKGKRTLVLTPKRDEVIEKSFRNIKSAKVDEERNVDASLALAYKYIIFVEPATAIKVLESRI